MLPMPIVDETGGMLNDPVAVKIAEDRWWISIADSDLLMWVKGIVIGYRLDVLVDEAAKIKGVLGFDPTIRKLLSHKTYKVKINQKRIVTNFSKSKSKLRA